MKKILLLLVTYVLFFVTSCTDEKKSYSVTEEGLEYKYCHESNSDKYPKNGQKLLLRIKFYNEKDTLLWDSREISQRFIMDFALPQKKGATVNDAYAMMQEGDSMSFKINAHEFYSAVDTNSPMLKKFRKDEKLRFEIKLEKIFSQEAFKNESEKIIKDMSELEKELLEDYIQRNYAEYKPTKSGLYFIEQTVGTGNIAKATDEVAIHFKATFINGEEIYSSYKKHDPLIFKVNDPLLYPCLAESVQKMRKGGKAICVSPSDLAAGKYGDKKMKIPPCKSIIFEIELVAIK